VTDVVLPELVPKPVLQLLAPEPVALLRQAMPLLPAMLSPTTTTTYDHIAANSYVTVVYRKPHTDAHTSSKTHGTAATAFSTSTENSFPAGLEPVPAL
jgi:hypothetical protein